MAEPIDSYTVIAFLEALKKRTREHYQDNIYTKNLMPDQAIRAHNNQVIEEHAIDIAICQVHFFENQDANRRRTNAGKLETAPARS